MTAILIVEDDVRLAESLGDYLAEFSFELDFAYNGEMCVELVSTNEYAAIIMDVAMPIMDGLTAARRIREKYHDSTPILFLTARDTLDDKLEGYNAGGDDYLVKPFASEELLARLRAILKRERKSSASIQRLGPLILDHFSRQAFHEDTPLNLHDIEFRLLAELARVAPDLVPRSKLETSLWPREMPESDPLRTHIYRLRQQLQKSTGTPLVLTVHSKGYRLAIPE